MQILITARWLLLIIFLLGFIVTNGQFIKDYYNYALLNFISIIAAYIILYKLKSVNSGNIIIWIILFSLIFGYYIKFYILVYGFFSGKSLLMMELLLGTQVPLLASNNILLVSYRAMTISLVALSVVTIILCNYKFSKIYNKKLLFKNNKKQCAKISIIYFIVAFVASFIFSFLRWYYDLGVPGTSVGLPYKIGGMITIISGYVIPILIGVGLTYAVLSENINIKILLILSFIIWGACHYLLFTSKTYLFLPIMWCILIGINLNMHIIKLRFIFVYAVTLACFYPFLNIYRHLRYTTDTQNMYEQIVIALNIGSETNQFSDMLTVFTWGILGILSRATGLDSLIILASLRENNSNGSMVNYLFSNEYSAEKTLTLFFDVEFTGVAQSLIGQAYYVSANYYIVALWIIFFSAFAYLISNYINNHKTPVAVGLWATWIISIIQWSFDGMTYFKFSIFFVSIFPVLIMNFFFKLKVNAKCKM